MLSASKNPDDKEKSFEYDLVIGYIPKPLQVDLFESLIYVGNTPA